MREKPAQRTQAPSKVTKGWLWSKTGQYFLAVRIAGPVHRAVSARSFAAKSSGSANADKAAILSRPVFVGGPAPNVAAAGECVSVRRRLSFDQ
jgi:hypothetical protein